MADAFIRFGPFVVDRGGYRVLRDGAALDVTPKLLDLLLYLIDRPATLVTKEELLDALWPDANVTDNALAQAMSELRDALGDDPAEPTFIKTVARKGYRFIGTLEAAAPAASQPAPDDLPAIAVMDFTNVSNDADSAWLSAGIAETVTGDLRTLGHFRVVDRWIVKDAVSRTDGSVHRVAADVGARLAVVGSYQRAGDRLRITARVVDVAKGDALADAKVDGALGDVFSLQDQITGQLAHDLGVGGARAARAATDTPSLAAYRAFSEGSVRLESLDVREIPRAIADFERAIAHDGRYALAHAGLANAELASYESTRSDNEPAVALLDSALAHAGRAIALDDTLAEAHATLAHAQLVRWDTAAARESARHAVALEPSNWRHQFRLCMASWGEERLRAAERTLALNPDFAFAYFQIAMLHVARGALVDAEIVLRQGAAVQDRQIGRGGRYPALGLHWLLGLVRLAQEDVAEACAEFDRERAVAEPHRLYGREYQMHALHARGLALSQAGDAAAARASFEQALALYPAHGPTLIALSRAADVDRAIAALDRARPIEAALVSAQRAAAAGRTLDAAQFLERMLTTAPPGYAGWTIPVEPLLRQAVHTPIFAGILTRLRSRAH